MLKDEENMRNVKFHLIKVEKTAFSLTMDKNYLSNIEFKLHTQLKKDLIELGETNISKVLLMPDTENPWIVLVPKVSNITELADLPEKYRFAFINEVSEASKGHGVRR